MRRIGRPGAALLLGGALCVAGCGGSDRDPGPSGTTGTPLLPFGGEAVEARAALRRFVAAHLGPAA